MEALALAGLVGSGLGLSSLAPSLSAQRVLAPISAQLVHLALLCDSALHHEQHHHHRHHHHHPHPRQSHQHERQQCQRCDVLLNLEPQAQALAEAAEALAVSSRRLSAESEDETTRREMPAAAERLLVAGRSVLIAALDLRVERRRRRRVAVGRLLSSATALVAAVLEVPQNPEVLTISDDTEVRRVERAAEWLHERASALGSVQSAAEFATEARGFSESLLLLTVLGESRAAEMQAGGRRRRRLDRALQTTRRCVPLIHTAVRTSLECPGSERAAAGRDRAVRRFSRAVSGVAAAARKGRRRRSEGDDGEVVPADEGSPRDATGTFADNVTCLVATLRRMNPGTKQEEEQENASEQMVTLDCLVEAVAAHAVTVMGETEHEGTRRRLSETCQRLLQCRSRLAARLRAPGTDAESARAAAASGSSSREREQMLREAAALRRVVTLAVTERVADAFAETTEPLERLLRAWGDRDGGDEGGRDDGALAPLADAFLAHADGMVRGAVLAHASCGDARRAFALRNRAALARRLASAARRELAAVGVRALAQSGLRQEWHREVDALLASLCRAVDVRGLADAVNASLGRFAHRFEDAVRGGGGSREVAETARATAGRAKLMARAARYFVSNHDDPLFRNGLLALVGPLESCTTLFAFEVNRHLRATESGDGRERGEGGDGDLSCSNESLVVVVAALLERSQQLVGHAGRVREGLSGSACHPDLLSPLRENLRNEGLDELTEIPDVVDVASRRAAMMTREHSTAAQHACDRRDPEQDKRACCGAAIAAGGHEDDCQATRSRLDDLSLLPAFSAVVRAAGLAHSDEAIRGSERRVRTLVDSYGEAVAKAKLGDPRCGEDSTWSDIDGRISGLREMTSRLLEEAGRIRDGGQGDAYGAASMALALRCSDGIRELQELLSRRLQPWLRLAREASDAAVTTDEPSPIAAVREVAASLAASAALLQKGGGDRPSGLRAAKKRRAGRVEQAALASAEPRLDQALLAVEEATRGLVGRGSGDGAERGSGDADERCVAAVGKCLAWAACVTSALSVLRRRTCVGGGAAAGLTGGVVRAVREGDRPALGVETRALLETCERLKETAGLAARAQTTARSNGGHGNGDNSSGDRHRGLTSLTLDEVALMSGAGDSACELARELAESAGLLLARAASPGGWAMARLAARVELLSTEVEARAHILSALIDRATASSARALLVTLGLEEEEENEGKDEKSGKEVAEVVSRTCLEEQLSEVEAAVRAALTQRPSDDHLGAAMESACRSLRWSAAQIDLALASRRQPEVEFSADSAAQAQRGGELRDERWCERRDELQLAAWAWVAASGSIAADLSAHLGPESPTVRDVVRRLRLEPVQENASAREKVDEEEEEKEEETRPGVPPVSSPGAAKEAKRAGSNVPESPAAAARRAFFAEMRQAGRAGRAAQESEPADVDRPCVPEAPPLPAEKAASVCGGGAAPSPSTHARRIEPRPCPLAPWDGRAVPDVARVAQDMASRVQDMALFLRRRGPIKSREGLIACARSLAVDARTLERFGGALAGLCAEERCSRELLSHSQRVLAAGTQIAILARVKEAVPRDRAADEALVHNARTLAEEAARVLRAAEAASVTGLRDAPPGTPAAEATALVARWRERLRQHRRLQALSGPGHLDSSLGLRRAPEPGSEPSLVRGLLPTSHATLPHQAWAGVICRG